MTRAAVKVLPLVGLKSLRLINVYQALMIGYCMVPRYAKEDIHGFLEQLKQGPERELENVIRTAASVVELDGNEIEAVVSFAADPNGIPYGKANVGNLGPGDLHEIIVAVMMEVTRIKVDLVTPEEKKN